ncbi:MAG: hypothetical protein FWE35_00845 [Streptosporangiales bacterium]|nr:hypothetical protein [Streptosporangiales bacterium]
MICRTCGADIAYDGPALFISRVTGLGYLAPVVHSDTGQEAGTDGHTAALTFRAAFDTPPPGLGRLAAA